MRREFKLPRAVLVAALAAPLCAAPPHIFFSDLESGPQTGGENNAGAFVTIYGTRFGAARGDSVVTIGGGRASSYPVWTDSRVTFQIGPEAASGPIVVTTAAGASNGVPFRVRPGRIYFVAVSGKDSADGSFGRPWRTSTKARDSMQPGDIVYPMDGVRQTADDGQGWNAALTLRPHWCGTEPGGAPRALVAYPGARVTLGDPRGPRFAVRTAGACSGWVFAGLTLRGASSAISVGAASWRIVGNDVSCPEGNGPAGCIETGGSTDIKLLGNNIHDAGAAGASALYHGVYFGAGTSQVEMGWNRVANVRGCRGVQVHSGSGTQHDIRIHHNLIHDTQCDGIVLYSVDPSQGAIRVDNNVIYNAGLGNTPERTGGWSCISVPGNTGSGTVDVDHNTLVNCGSNPAPPYSGANGAVVYGGPKLRVRLRNNIVVQARGVPYVTNLGAPEAVHGSHNLFFGSGPPPSGRFFTNSLSADPRFWDLLGGDFRLTAASPARGQGTAAGAEPDRDGLARGGAAGYDLGAHQFDAAPAARAGEQGLSRRRD